MGFGMRRITRVISMIVICVFLVSSAALGLVPADTESLDAQNSIRSVAFFVHDENGYLAEYRVQASTDDESGLRAAFEALLSEPLPPNLWREIPEGTRLIDVTLLDGTVYLDLSREFSEGLTNNTNATFIKQSILYTAYQFPEVQSVYIMVEGKPADDHSGQGMSGPFFKVNFDPPSLTTEIFGPDIDPLSLLVPAPRVFIDAGHGGIDPGAVASDGTQEKDINFDVALKLRSYVQGNGGYVGMTRTGDTYVRYGQGDPLRTTPPINGDDMKTVAELADNYQADLFVSIHSNAGPPSVRGFEIFYPLYRSNAVSKNLATRINNQYTLRYASRGVFANNFAVLEETTMPAVLAELGWLTNADDLDLLKSPAERQWMAYYIFRGINDFWCGGRDCIWEP